jgi:hypothetical protein
MGDHSFDGNELIAFPAEDCNANRATMAVMWAGLEVWFSKPLLGLKPLSDLDSDDSALAKFAAQSGVQKGKSLEHIQMQDCIRSNPRLVLPNLQGDVESSSCEYLFWSLDRADVVAKTSEEWIGFEVKPSTAPFEELKKGIYQVMKYRALLAADLLSRGRICRSRCVLVIGGSLPKELRLLATRFGIQVFEKFRCPS